MYRNLKEQIDANIHRQGVTPIHLSEELNGIGIAMSKRFDPLTYSIIISGNSVGSQLNDTRR